MNLLRHRNTETVTALCRYVADVAKVLSQHVSTKFKGLFYVCCTRCFGQESWHTAEWLHLFFYRNGVSEFLLRLTESDDVMINVVDALNRAAPPVMS